MGEGVIAALAALGGILARELFGWFKNRWSHGGDPKRTEAERLWDELTDELNHVRTEREELRTKLYETERQMDTIREELRFCKTRCERLLYRMNRLENKFPDEDSP